MSRPPTPATNKSSIRPLLLPLLLMLLASPASAAWKEKVLYSFQGVPDGSLPVGAVVFDRAGNLYGATRDGGSSSCVSVQQCGTVYRLAPPVNKGDPWTEKVLYTFKGNASQDGASPEGGLVLDASGNLYGTTGYGGTGNCTVLGTLMGCGTVYELSPPQQKGGKWTETVLYSFPTPKQGFVPFGDLVFDRKGNLYGATLFGGGKGTTCNGIYEYCGAVFEVSPPKSKGGEWTEDVLHGFAGGKDGASPNGGLVLDGKGNIYGTTYIGGYNCPHSSGQGCGTAFELTPPLKSGGEWGEKLIHLFKDGADGLHPLAGMVFDGTGNLYGTTFSGGTVFRLAPPSEKSGSWTKTTLHAFSGSRGGFDPQGALVFDSAGNIYGTTSVGTGGSLRGNVFRLKPPNGMPAAWAISVVHGFTGIPDGENPTTKLIFDRAGNLYSTTQYGGTGSACSFTGCGAVFEVSP